MIFSRASTGRATRSRPQGRDQVADRDLGRRRYQRSPAQRFTAVEVANRIIFDAKSVKITRNLPPSLDGKFRELAPTSAHTGRATSVTYYWGRRSETCTQSLVDPTSRLAQPD